ncbi:MAG TPA: hypothetical protein VGB37_09390 [Candidatus Lokiarchaeia archaeon]
MLVTISFASAINSNTTNVEKKESPLYRIRTRLAIGEKIGQIFKNIKTKFLGDRMFFLPFLVFNDGNDHSIRQYFGKITDGFVTTLCPETYNQCFNCNIPNN